MKTLFLVAAAWLGIAACVTSGPESPEPAAGTNKPVTNGNSTKAAGQLEVGELPKVSDSVSIPTQALVICRKERPTGSYISKPVCRTRTAR